MTVADSARLKRELLVRTLFPTMPSAGHARIVELLEDVEVRAGEVLFDVGDPPDQFLFLTEGRVVMEREDGAPWEFTPVSVIGVIDAVWQRPRKRSCRAKEASRLLKLRSADWFDLLEDNAEIARAVVRNFANQLHTRWRRLAHRVQRHSELPPPLSPGPMETYDKILALRRASFLGSAGMQAIVSLAAVAEPRHLRQGELLFDVGADADTLYVLTRGRVELTTRDGFSYTYRRGDLIGGPAALCGALPDYAARASSDATLLCIAEQDFYDQAEEHGRLTRGTLKFLISELEPLLELNEGAPEESRLSAGD